MLRKTIAIIGIAIAGATACLPAHAYIDYNGDGIVDDSEKTSREVQVVNDVIASQNAHSSTDCIGEMKRHWPANTHSWAMGIMKRESGYTASAQNPRSTAAGCFQLLKMHSHRYDAVGCSWADRYNAHCNVQAAYHLYQAAGTSPWNF